MHMPPPPFAADYRGQPLAYRRAVGMHVATTWVSFVGTRICRRRLCPNKHKTVEGCPPHQCHVLPVPSGLSARGPSDARCCFAVDGDVAGNTGFGHRSAPPVRPLSWTSISMPASLSEHDGPAVDNRLPVAIPRLTTVSTGTVTQAVNQHLTTEGQRPVRPRRIAGDLHDHGVF